MNYDLQAYNALVNPGAPNRITEREVQQAVRKLTRGDAAED